MQRISPGGGMTVHQLTASILTVALAAFTAAALAQPCPDPEHSGGCPPPAGGPAPAAAPDNGAPDRIRHSQALLTPEERAVHQEKIHGLKTYAECTAYLAQHRSLLETRAKEKGLKLPPLKNNLCDDMRAHGRFQ
jgi:hypothetical protein